jgi:hypothetical protein
MKFLDMLKSPFSLGWMALVMLAMAILVLVGFQFVFFAPAYDDSLAQMQLLNTLEGELTKNLYEMQKNEAYAIYNIEFGLTADDPTDYAALADAKNLAMDEQLANITEDLLANETYGEDLQTDLQSFHDYRSQHRQTFSEVIQLYGNPDLTDARDRADDLQGENTELSAALANIIYDVDRIQQQTQKQFPAEANTAITATAISLVGVLLLALVGYQRIGAAVDPLNALTNAIMAIGGGQYRDSLLAGLMKRLGPAGDCARSLDGLAKGLTTRSAGQNHEVGRLKEVLLKSRKRRLKVAQPMEKRS